MKFRSKITAVLLALVLLISAFGAFSVSATEEEEYQYTKEEIQEAADYYGMSYKELLAAMGLTEEDLVDGSAFSSTDAVYSYTDMLADVEFKTFKSDSHNISYKFPKDGTVYLPSDDIAAVAAHTGISLKDIMNNYNLVVIAEYTNELNGANVLYQIIAEEDTPYGKHIGNYKNLTDSERDALVQSKIDEGFDENNTYMIKKKGNVYLVARSDSDEVAESGFCITETEISTVINGTIYTAYIYIQHGGTTADAKVVEDILDSLIIKGSASTVTVSKTLSIVALCIAGVLFIVVLFLIFFIVRFSIYSKASGSRFNIIGFSMPKKNTERAVSKRNFRAESNIKDSLD